MKSQSLTEVSCTIGPILKPPATLARQSIFPKRSIIFATELFTEFTSVKSVSNSPTFLACFQRGWVSFAKLISTSAMLAPARKKSSAVVEPSAPAAPVMITTLSLKLKFMNAPLVKVLVAYDILFSATMCIHAHRNLLLKCILTKDIK